MKDQPIKPEEEGTAGHDSPATGTRWPAYTKRATSAAPPPDRHWKGFLPVAGLSLAALLLSRSYGWNLWVQALLALAALLLVAGLAFPGVLKRIEAFGDLLGKGVGAGLTWALLTPLYFLVFAPARLVLRLSGKDPLRRRFPASESSYWVVPSPADAGRDRRQF